MNRFECISFYLFPFYLSPLLISQTTDILKYIFWSQKIYFKIAVVLDKL